MQQPATRPVHPELKQLVVQASQSLARLDADRLEELALSCKALNGELPEASTARRAELARQAKDALADLAVFAKVLEVTRANLNVMNRLRQLRGEPLEYGEAQLRSEKPGWALVESEHGDN